jgi:hypothetical protein
MGGGAGWIGISNGFIDFLGGYKNYSFIDVFIIPTENVIIPATARSPTVLP